MELLDRSEEIYRKMVEEVSDYAILLMDKDGNIVNWNKGAEKIKGYKPEEIIGKNFRLFYLPEDREQKVPESLIEDAIKHGKASAEGYRLRKDGTTFWGSILITALHDSAGNVIGFTKVTRDLTERKTAEDRIKQYAADLEKRNRELTHFAYISSHDLQEPLRKIRVFASQALERNTEYAMRVNLSKIEASAFRMSTLIKGLLHFMKITDTPFHSNPVNLTKVINNVLQDLEVVISEKQAVIEFENLPVVEGVEIQLYQLFLNLVNNALKFSEKTPFISITSIILNDTEQYAFLNTNQKYYAITVEDNGIGFEQKYADKIFLLFQRLSSNYKYPGTGIGLSLCKKIVEDHNGFISATSEVGVGTKFTIILPASTN